MKKILTLLCIALLVTACGSDNPGLIDNDNGGGNNSSKGTTTQLGTTNNPIAQADWKGFPNDPESPNYVGKGNKYVAPILGDWVLTTQNGKPADRFVVFQFKWGGGWYSILQKPAVGEVPYFTNMMFYEYNDTQIREDKTGVIYNYLTSADLSTMTLFDGTNTWGFKKYDNNGVWDWQGSWNSTDSPYYAVYNGHYNPIKGEWKVVQIRDMYSPLSKQYFKFNYDFTIYYKDTYYDDNYEFYSRYILDNISVKSESILGYQTNKYWITGDTLYLQGVDDPFYLREISKLVRVGY